MHTRIYPQGAMDRGNGSGQSGRLHRLQRQRRQSLPMRMWSEVLRFLRVENATDVEQSDGLDGDVWYATDYAYPNHWPYSEQPTTLLPLTKRRRVFQKAARAKFDVEFFVGLFILVGAYFLYLYLTAPATEHIPATRTWTTTYDQP